MRAVLHTKACGLWNEPPVWVPIPTLRPDWERGRHPILLAALSLCPVLRLQRLVAESMTLAAFVGVVTAPSTACGFCNSRRRGDLCPCLSPTREHGLDPLDRALSVPRAG